MDSRIPAYDSTSPEGMQMWFAEMSARGLLFHPEDDPASILRIGTWERTFTDSEAEPERKLSLRQQLKETKPAEPARSQKQPKQPER